MKPADNEILGEKAVSESRKKDSVVLYPFKFTSSKFSSL